MFKTFTKAFSLFFAGILMTMTMTGCTDSMVDETQPPEATVESLVLDPVNSTHLIGEKQVYKLIANLSDGDQINVTAEGNYTSSHPAIASISANGVAIALSEGTATITASYELNGVTSSATAMLKVLAPTTTVEALAIDPVRSTQLIGGTQVYQVTAILSTGDKVDATAKVTYSSSDIAIAVIGTDGVAHAIGEGSATITASYDGIDSEATLTVAAPAATIDSLVIDPEVSTQLIGGTQAYQVTAILDTGDKVDGTTQVTYSSSNETVAVVNAHGVADAIAAGTTTITATYDLNGDISTVEATLTVEAATIDALVIDPVDSERLIGDTQAYKVIAILSTGDPVDATTKVSYSSDTPTVALIGTDGVAHAIGEGNATITASYNLDGTVSEATATLTVTAQAVTITSLVIDPAVSTKPTGGTQAYQVTAILNTGDKVDATDKTTYSSSNETVAVIGGDGIAYAVGEGSATITASYNLDGTISTTTAILTVADATDLIKIEIEGAHVSDVRSSIALSAWATYNGLPNRVEVTNSVEWTPRDANLNPLIDGITVTNYSQEEGTNGGVVRATYKQNIDGSVTIKGPDNGLIVATLSDGNGGKIDSNRHSVRFTNGVLKYVEIRDGSTGEVISDGDIIDIQLVDSVSYSDDNSSNGSEVSPNAYYPVAYAMFEDGNEEYITANTLWWSDNQSHAYVNYLKGPFVFGRYLTTEPATISVNYGHVKASFKVNVVPSTNRVLERIELWLDPEDESDADYDVTGQTVDVRDGFKQWVTAYGFYVGEADKVNINSSVVYTTSDRDTAYVTQKNSSEIFGVSVGQADITAVWQGKTATVKANVTQFDLQSIQIELGAATDGSGTAINSLDVVVDETPLDDDSNDVYISAFGHYDDGNGMPYTKVYINTMVHWSEADKTIARVGFLQSSTSVKGITVNESTTITAQLDDINATIPVNVLP